MHRGLDPIAALQRGLILTFEIAVADEAEVVARKGYPFSAGHTIAILPHPSPPLGHPIFLRLPTRPRGRRGQGCGTRL